MEPDHLTESEHLASQPPPAPRAIGRAAARASWGDLRVRLWWITALAVGIVALLVAGQEITFLLAERDLILHGTELTAKLLSLDNITRPGYRLLRTDSHDVRLQTTMPDGRQIDLEGRMGAGPGSLQVGSDIPIKIDPKDPAHWTDRTEMASWGVELALPLALLPIIALLLAMAIYRRSQVLRVWREGEPVEGVVVELKHTAIAPLSRLVRYSIPADPSKRVYSVLVPVRAGVPAAGEALQLLARNQRPHWAVVTRLYEGS